MSDSKITINAWASTEPKGKLSLTQVQEDALSSQEVLIKVTHCGICHSDIHIIDGDWGPDASPYEKQCLVPGHEIVGHVQEVGSGVKSLAVGDRVGVGWNRSSCDGSCETCLRGMQQMCSEVKATCAGGGNGGYADLVRCDARWALKVPDNLASEHACVLMCGGVTVFAPIDLNTQPGDAVGIVSMGGLGSMGVALAAARGNNVTAISRGTDKKDLALSLGAHRYIDSSDTKQLVAAANSLDLILFTSAHDMPWNHYISMLKPNGKILFNGIPPTSLSIHVGQLLFKQLSIGASLTGGMGDMHRMLQVAAAANVKPLIETFDFKDVNTALDKVRANKVRFRAVLVHPGESAHPDSKL